MKKQMAIALFVCAGLGIFYFATQEKTVRVGIRVLDLPRIDPQSITSVHYEGKQNFALNKKGTDFVLEWKEGDTAREAVAGKEVVKELFDAVSQVKGGVFVTEQVAKQAEFKVDDATGQKVRLFVGDKPVWELIIGDYADEGGRYVRVPSQNAVFLAKARFWDITRSDVIDFRERKIVGLHEDAIESIRVEKGAEQLVGLVRDDKKKWEFDAKTIALFPGLHLSAGRAADLVKVVTGLRAASFVEAPEALQKVQQLLNTSTERVIVSHDAGSELVVVLANNPKEKKAYAQVKGASTAFEISDYVYGRLHPKAEDFKEPAASEKKNANSLPPDIQRQVQEAMRQR